MVSILKLLKVRLFRFVLFAATTGLLAAGSALAPATAAPATPPSAAASPAATPPASGTNPAPLPVSPDYRVGPGDNLHVFVFENEQLSVTVPVRPDGKISTPLVEDMVAVGKTPSQLARDIETALSKYVKTPKVNVEVVAALSVYSQIKVIGQVKEPQAMPLS